MKLPEKNLSVLVKNTKPILHNGAFAFVSVKTLDEIPVNDVVCTMKEKEGFTVVLSVELADSLQLKYDTLFSWITLEVQSSLEAVGFTAVFSTALGKSGISCNVIAGYHHDHLLVPQKDSFRAMETLKNLETFI